MPVVLHEEFVSKLVKEGVQKAGDSRFGTACTDIGQVMWRHHWKVAQTFRRAVPDPPTFVGQEGDEPGRIFNGADFPEGRHGMKSDDPVRMGCIVPHNREITRMSAFPQQAKSRWNNHGIVGMCPDDLSDLW